MNKPWRDATRALPLLGILLCLADILPAKAGAITPAEWNACEGSHPNAEKIAGCTKIINNPAATAADRIKAYSKRAWTHSFDNGKEAAYADFSEAIKLDPANAFNYQERARMMANAGEIDRPIADYTTAVNLQPAGYMLFSRGELHHKKGDLDRAAADFTQAAAFWTADIAAHPEQAWLYRSRSNAYRNLGDIDRALSDFDEFLKQKTDSFDPQVADRGDLYLRKGDVDHAIADYTTAIGGKPDANEPYQRRALAYRLKGDYKSAILDYDHLIAYADNDPQVWIGRGLAYVGAGKPERAVVDFTKAIDVFPKDATAFYDRAQAQREMGNLEVAIADYSAAIALDPRYAIALNSRGNAYLAQNDLTRALADFNDAIRLKDKFAAAFYNRAFVEQASGQPDDAIADFGRAIAADPANKTAFIARALALYRKGSFAEAEKDCTAALTIDPIDENAYIGRAQARLKLGKLLKALDDANRAVLINRQSEWALKARAEIYEALGQRDKALVDQAAAEGAQHRRDEARRAAEAAQKHQRLKVTIVGAFPQAPPYLKMTFKFDNKFEVRDDEITYYVPTIKPFKMASGEIFEEDFAGLCDNRPTSNRGHRSVTAVFDKYLFQLELNSRVDFATGACRGRFNYYKENYVIDVSDGGCKFSYWTHRDMLGNNDVEFRVSDQICVVETLK
jgi:tetratricopeptide (TPR) repeat protein